ncbi:MAG: SIMPL domain-containing protein [bacterium]|nr:SIMPL domain-containing protein [bacterium]
MPYTMEQQRHTALVVLGGILAITLAVLAVATTAVKVREYRAVGSAPVERTLTVSGMGKVRAAPNLASVSAGITVEALNAADAQEQSNKKMESVLQEIRAAGIPEEDMQTSNYSVYPQYDYTDGVSRIRGYAASQTVQVQIRDLDRVNAVFAALMKGGATNVDGLQFSIDDSEGLKAQAREQAIANAREQAQMIAEQLGVRLGKATQFSESGGAYPPIMYDRAMGMGGGGAPEIQRGENEIAVSVTVTYAME